MQPLAAWRDARCVSKGFAGIGPALRSLKATDSRATLAQFAAAALDRAHRKLTTEADGADWSAASARHALRIRVKRLRYSCEFFAPAFPARRVTPYITALKTLQDVLGELNDMAVGRRLLGVAGDEAALLRRLGPAWRAAERRAGILARASLNTSSWGHSNASFGVGALQRLAVLADLADQQAARLEMRGRAFEDPARRNPGPGRRRRARCRARSGIRPAACASPACSRTADW